MAVTLEIMKRVECEFYTRHRNEVTAYLQESGDTGKEIIPLWHGLHFAGFAVFNSAQYDYFSRFMNMESFVGFYDGVKLKAGK